MDTILFMTREKITYRVLALLLKELKDGTMTPDRAEGLLKELTDFGAQYELTNDGYVPIIPELEES